MTHYEKITLGSGPGGPWVNIVTLLHWQIQANSTLVLHSNYCGLRIGKPDPNPNNYHIILIFYPTTIEYSDAPDKDCKTIDILDTQFYDKIKDWLTYHNITIKDEQWPKA